MPLPGGGLPLLLPDPELELLELELLPPELLLPELVPPLLLDPCPLLEPAPDELPVTPPLLELGGEPFIGLVVEPLLEALVFVVGLGVALDAGVCVDPALVVLEAGPPFQGVDEVDVGPEHSQAPPASATTTQVGAIHLVFLIVTSSNR